MNSAKYAKEIAPVKLNVHAQWKEAFRLLVLSRKVETRTENTQLFGWRKGRALRAHNLIKQKWVTPRRLLRLILQQDHLSHTVSTSGGPLVSQV
jgi:hypothetical protein